MVIWVLVLLGMVLGTAQGAEVPGPDAKLTDKEVRDLASSYVNWSPRDAGTDADNPYRVRVVAQGERSVAPLIELAGKDQDRRVIWVLGEIGSSKAFAYLLDRYIREPAKRTAISIGSCIRKDEVAILFRSDSVDPAELRTLVAEILGTDAKTIQTVPVADLQNRLLRELPKINERNRLRSVPEPG